MAGCAGLAGCASAAGDKGTAGIAAATAGAAHEQPPGVPASAADASTGTPGGAARPPATASWTPGAAGASNASGGNVLSASVVAAMPVCAARALDGALDDTEGTAGHLYARLVLTNRGGASCRLTGYPEVQFVDVAGAAFGAPADDDEGAGPAAPVPLTPEGSATSALRITQPGIQSGCLTVDETRLAVALRVVLPGESDAVRIELSTGGITACVSPGVRQLLVGPFTS
jgi:hypothetical protein